MRTVLTLLAVFINAQAFADSPPEKEQVSLSNKSPLANLYLEVAQAQCPNEFSQFQRMVGSNDFNIEISGTKFPTGLASVTIQLKTEKYVLSVIRPYIPEELLSINVKPACAFTAIGTSGVN